MWVAEGGGFFEVFCSTSERFFFSCAAERALPPFGSQLSVERGGVDNSYRSLCRGKKKKPM